MSCNAHRYGQVTPQKKPKPNRKKREDEVRNSIALPFFCNDTEKLETSVKYCSQRLVNILDNVSGEKSEL